MLTACGGGGSAIEPSSTYSGDALLAYNTLSQKREQCGFGGLAQNPDLDRSAAAHLAYMVGNRDLTHYETAATPGFTGTGPTARAAAAGYIGSVGEIMAGSSLWVASWFPAGDVITESLMDVPYHAVVAFSGFRDVGIAYGGGAIVIDPGVQTGQPRQDAPGVRTYPCEGTTGVRPSVSGEEPTPFPGEPAGTLWGPSISVVGHAVQVTGASITDASGSPVQIKAILGDGATKDPNGFCRGPNACVIPAPLQPGATYSVRLQGTDSGAPFDVRFAFSTAAE